MVQRKYQHFIPVTADCVFGWDPFDRPDDVRRVEVVMTAEMWSELRQDFDHGELPSGEDLVCERMDLLAEANREFLKSLGHELCSGRKVEIKLHYPSEDALEECVKTVSGQRRLRLKRPEKGVAKEPPRMKRMPKPLL